ncbi:alpha/beta hydrolase [Microbacterium sp. ASV81]|uniref:Alpha/beta hydrolase fold domain-containing protein n=1 Tax=Microbacterium capsulatum TaxID=3041921 RepID=A0ABU0XHH5_9MICO|nr:alpha/beta hydrolase fold domain-containing protein [Microbacterium sp. ASV81]MDQ4214573.1 alpha/beta hydrolase fold domain-containing protein [Microbacterium sp. ASV81]
MTLTAAGHPTVPPVPFDPEVQAVLDTLAADPQPPLTRETLPREGVATMFPDNDTVISGRPIDWEDRVIPGPAGDPGVEVTVFRPRGDAGSLLPAFLNIHGGGQIVGHRSWETGRVVDIVAEHGVVAVNVEYRLAPEHPSPAGLDDCYAALLWLHAHAAELGVDPDRIVVGGGSAGGGLAAGVALLARDRQGPPIAGQLLLCPMLDNTNATVSSRQYDGIGTWQREANLLAWSCLLGEELAHSPEASAYAAPAHAVDLSRLAPAYIEVGAAEMFRDEDTQYALRIWAAGGQAELHVWAGGAHGFDMYMPEAEISRAALAARASWLRRIWGRS